MPKSLLGNALSYNREACMRLRKHQSMLDMEQQTGSK